MATSRTLPIPHNLLITTPSTIYLYSHSTTKTLFECSETSGILTVKAARDNSGLLAIADSQLVILHDITQGTDRKHTLKRGDGSPRILLFTPDSKTLIFTTTLSNTIQTYSISTGELLPPLQSHPSPPTAVTISPNGTILLTASSKPPTVLLQDMRTIGAAALTFRPTISEAAVSCASFQCKHSRGQENYTTFILGFRDGTLALYRLYIPNLPRNPQAWRLYPQRVLLHKPNELGVYRRLHKPAMGGITAAEFLPGYKARVISVGYDGRCRLVDFSEISQVLRTWYIDGPAVCLSVNLGKPNKSVGRTQKAVNFSDSTIEVEELPYQGIETLIAIGIQTGKVLIFNILGLLVHEVVLDFPVIGVEWVGDMSAPCPLPRRASMSPPTQALKHESIAQPDQPALDLCLSEYSKTEEQQKQADVSDSGTIRRKKSRKRSPSPAGHGSSSPLRFQIETPKDLFSPAFTPISLVSQKTAPAPRDESQISYGSPEKRSRTTYPRPRIVTETLKMADSAASFPNLDLSPSSAKLEDSLRTASPRIHPKGPFQGITRTSPIATSPQTPVMSGALPSSVNGVVPQATQSDPTGIDFWYTPQTSHHARSPTVIKTPIRSSLSQPGPGYSFSVPKPPTQSQISNLRRSSLPRLPSPQSRPSRKVTWLNGSRTPSNPITPQSTQPTASLFSALSTSPPISRISFSPIQKIGNKSSKIFRKAADSIEGRKNSKIEVEEKDPKSDEVSASESKMEGTGRLNMTDEARRNQDDVSNEEKEKLLQVNAALRSEVEALRREMQFLREVFLEGREW